MDEHNHALAALRYLVSRLDERQLARRQRSEPVQEAAPRKPAAKRWLRLDSEALWQRVW